MMTAAEMIAEARFNANVNDTNKFNDTAMLRILNHAIKEVYKIVYRSNPANCPFCTIAEIILIEGQESYPIPMDIFALSCIYDMRMVENNGNYSSRPLRRLPISARAREYGYSIVNKTFYISPKTDASVYQKILMTYLPNPIAIDTLTDSPDLPDACEEYLISYMEKKIQAIESSSDVQIATGFTQEEKVGLAEIFSVTSGDPDYPDISDETYVAY